MGTPAARAWLIASRGLRHDAVIGRHHQHDDVRHLGAPGAHGRESLVAGRVQERDFAAVDGHLIGACALGDAASFTGGDIGVADTVEQGGLAVVDVAQHRHHRRAFHQVVNIFVFDDLLDEAVTLGGATGLRLPRLSSTADASRSGQLTATPSSSPKITAVSWSMLWVIGAMMPYCISTLMRSIGLRSINLARSRTVMESATTTAPFAGVWPFAVASPFGATTWPPPGRFCFGLDAPAFCLVLFLLAIDFTPFKPNALSASFRRSPLTPTAAPCTSRRKCGGRSPAAHQWITQPAAGGKQCVRRMTGTPWRRKTLPAGLRSATETLTRRLRVVSPADRGHQTIMGPSIHPHPDTLSFLRPVAKPATRQRAPQHAPTPLPAMMPHHTARLDLDHPLPPPRS